MASSDTSTGEPPDPAQLVERYGDVVYNLAVRLTGHPDQARDLAQDAFVRILQGLATFRGEASLKTWVCRVVVNCHRNRARWWHRLKRGPAVSLDDPVARDGRPTEMTLGSTLASTGRLPDEDLERAETRGRIEQELMRLPRDQRAAVVMREMEGMSYAEIALALGIREGTVKSRLARARESLRRALSDLHPRGDET